MKTQHPPLRVAGLSLALSAVLASLSGCGGGSASPGSGTSVPPPSPPLQVAKVDVAQSHLIPPAGLSWTTKDAAPLILAAERETLVMARLAQADVKNPVVEVWDGATLLGTQALTPPTQPVAIEGGEKDDIAVAWSATLAAAWVKPGITLKFRADSHGRSADIPVSVGPATDLTMQILPFVLFGATDANTGLNLAAERVMRTDDAMRKEAEANLPLSRLKLVNHPAGQFESPFLVIPPLSNGPAYVATSSHELKEDWHVVNTVNDVLYLLHKASGDKAVNKVSYAPFIVINRSAPGPNQRTWIGRGVSLVGSGIGTGVNDYGMLWHETAGHGMGLGHSNEESLLKPAYYPYEGGSLKGSAWGYNSAKKQLRSPLIPLTAPAAQWCKDNAYPMDAASSRCYRKDPMDNADGGNAPGFNFPQFSDHNAARIAKWVQVRPRLDASSPTGFSKWDPAQIRWVPFEPKTEGYAFDGIAGGMPVIAPQPVVKITATYSHAGTLDVNRFYPPLPAVEASVRSVDPLDTAELAKIQPWGSGGNQWYCHESGCDHTLRVTFSDGSEAYRVLQGSFRKRSYPEDWNPSATNPVARESLQMWSVNVPMAKGLRVKKLELLDTPMVWKLSPAQVKQAKALVTETY